jgi:hypothetical protein
VASPVGFWEKEFIDSLTDSSCGEKWDRLNLRFRWAAQAANRVARNAFASVAMPEPGLAERISVKSLKLRTQKNTARASLPALAERRVSLFKYRTVLMAGFAPERCE